MLTGPLLYQFLIWSREARLMFQAAKPFSFQQDHEKANVTSSSGMTVDKRES